MKSLTDVCHVKITFDMEIEEDSKSTKSFIKKIQVN